LANGGYSLEVPNPFYFCDNSGLLRPSLDPLRGTPGKENSIFTRDQETAASQLEQAWFQDSLTVHLVFSKGIFPGIEKEMFAFSPILELDSLFFLSEKELAIFLKSPAKENELYQLSLVGLRDCWGNELGIPGITELVFAARPKQGELVINEVLFDPRSGDPKFVELRNVSKRFLNLDSFGLANLDDLGKPDQLRKIESKGLILPPDGHLAITTDVNRLKLSYPKSTSGNYFQMPTLPSYPISGGTVVLLASDGAIMETFTYDQDLHHPLLRDSKGVSLERISPFSPAIANSNWQSASGNEDYGTPGRKNSQSIEGEMAGNLIQIEPEVFDPEGSSGPAFTSIRYELDQSGWVGTFKIFSIDGQLIQILAQNQILGTNGIFTWTGTDSTGKRVRVGYYVLMVELYEPNGKTNLIKRTIVVGARL
jgi:hypothetical protein